MTTIAATATTSPTGTTARRVGTTLLVLVSAFLLVDAVIHTLNTQVVAEAMADLGYPGWTATFIGVLELVGVALYVVPRTRLLGAVWLTAYLGGAFASQVRIEAPVFSTLLFPVYVGLALWAAVLLRDPELRRVALR
ncbi:MAG: DoxX family protein [Nocardioides sp.]